MKIAEAKAVAADPARHPDKLRLARLKIYGAELRTFPSSPRQKALTALRNQIEAMPRELWSLERP